MKITEKLERAAGAFLTLNDRSDFDLGPVCKLLKEAHDYILELEAGVVTRARLAERDRSPAVIGFIADSYAGTRSEQDGFAEEFAMQYGFFPLDDDVEVYAATRNCLVQMLTAVGYQPANNAAARGASHD